MKITKPVVLAIATVAVLTGTGVAAAYSDIQLIPAGPRAVHTWAEPTATEPTTEPVSENKNSDTSSSASPENDTPAVSSPAPQTNTPNETEAINEPAPAVEEDPTPEPLPAPDTNITHVENPNTVLGNNTAGNVSHN